jgi:hypothetical protein
MGDLALDLALVSEHVAETHTAWVFLTRREAYKVKKPVDFGFLDFRTPELRRRACEAEVKLNARLAPDVYRGVVPIRRGGDGVHRIAGEGEIVDWAVSMVRLPDERRADVLLGQGALSDADLDRVSRKIARFHREARADAQTARFGMPDVIERNVLENFAQAQTSFERAISREEEEEIERWQLSFLRGHADVFTRRAEAGRVRDGHGDLRLEHVYLHPPGEITVIDCIEFNERFRFADVCADVAFLSMDLAAHGRVDLAERFLASYAKASGD